MWSFVIFVISISVAESQLDRPPNGQFNIKLPVPGDPGGDYPVLDSIPRTSFTCAGKEPGYYADPETNCQVFKVCTAGSTYGFQSFLCPNGTLFNQAVFVCDWWMNVDCAKSQEIVTQNQKLGNVKLGPQFIKEIKKMLTHPLRNPYDSGYYKNNLVVMQEYRPPTEQLFPNGNFIKNQQNIDNNIYVPSKGFNRSFGQNYQTANDINFAASTAAPQYISSFNSIEKYRGQNEKINTFQNSKNGYLTQNQAQIQPTTSPQANYAKTNFQNNNPRQPYIQSNQNYHQNTPVNNNNNGGTINTEAKQNLVSNHVTPTIISKTIAIKTIVPGEKLGRPKSRITFKTWILKPKNSKLVVEPESNNMKNPTPTSLERLSSSFEPYVYKKPLENLDLTKNNYYTYNKPTTTNIVTSTESFKSRLYEAPTTFRPIIPSKLYLPPDTPIPITERPIDFISSTYQSLTNSYLPPTAISQLSRQYLSPIIASQKSQLNKNARLVAASSSQTPQFEYFNPKNSQKPTLTVTKQSITNTNHNNISFTDTHTKEKIDITVNDVIKNTFNKPKVSRPAQTAQFRNGNNFNSILPNPQRSTGSREELSPEFAAIKRKNSRLVASPSTELQPPVESKTNYVPTNKLVNLPYYKEPTNTIERTVSIKITIPEKIAKYLFKNDSNSDDLEILNTGSSNYLVYANNLAANTGASLTPIGKLSLIKNTNISNSQDLVFSFLADSLNAAKEYNNIAKQTVASTSTTPLQQNNRNNNAQQINNSVSQLTSSQYSVNSFGQNIVQQYASQQKAKTTNNKINQLTNTKNQFGYQQTRSQPITKPSQPQTSYQSTTIPRQNVNTLQNARQIYSGQLYQLPVPEVTRDYYNSPNIQQPNEQQRHISNIPQNIQQKLANDDIEIIPSQLIPFNTLQQTSSFQSNEQNNPSKELNNLIRSGNGITAQLKDSIVGTLAHPTEKDKHVTYKKDQSYYIFSQVNLNDHENNRINAEKSDKLRQQSGNNNEESLQFIPSVGYKLNNVKDQQQILNTFKLNHFGVPQGTVNGYKNPVQRQDVSTDVDYTINHPPSNFGDKISSIKSLYDGPSSYNAPQRLYNFEKRQAFLNDQRSRIEDLDDNEQYGYPKISPLPKFET